MGDGGTILKTTPPAGPDSVALLQPDDGAADQLTPLPLRWKTPPEGLGSDSIRYQLQLSTDAAFTAVFMQDSSLVDPIYQLDSLDFGGTNVWRVRAFSNGVAGPWSESRLFMTPEVSSIPCQVVRRLQARCQPSGTFAATVTLTSFNYTGEMLTLTIDGIQYQAEVQSASCGGVEATRSGESESLVWRDDGNNLTGMDLPATTELLGSYPNPFNSVATISFRLAEPQLVELKIYDILGREVVTLVHEVLPAGTYSRRWIATGNATGLYLYRFSAGDAVQTGRLVQGK